MTGDTNYELYAITCHFGTMTSGHYTAFAKSPTKDPEYKDKWFYFDDDNVSIIKDMSAYIKKDKKLRTAAYVLFYRKQDLDYQPHKPDMEFLNNVCGGEGSGPTKAYRFPVSKKK